MSSGSVRADVNPRLLVEAKGTLSSLRFLSEIVQRFLVDGCGLKSDTPTTVHTRLAIQEAMTNVLRHAYAGREPGPIEIELAREGDCLVARLRDEGTAYDPRRLGKSAIPSSDSLAEGGYGLGIIEHVMTDVDYSYSAQRGNQLVMRKKLW